MEAATLWIAFVAACGTTASAIFAGFAMADAARSRDAAKASAEVANKARTDAAQAQRDSASSLNEMTSYLTTEPAKLRRREVCLALIDAFLDVVSLPGQSRDMLHSEENVKLIDAERRILFELGRMSEDSRVISFERVAFDDLHARQLAGTWDEAHGSRLKGIVASAVEDLSTESRDANWWTSREAELRSAISLSRGE